MVDISEAELVLLCCDVVSAGAGESAQDSRQYCPLHLWQNHLWVQQTAEQPHQSRGAHQQVSQQAREETRTAGGGGGGGEFSTGTLQVNQRN